MKRAFLLLLLVFTAGAYAGVNSWTLTGPEGGQAYGVAFHPDTGVVFAVAGTSLYRSTDGAQSWHELVGRVGGGGGRVLVHPTNPNLVMMSTVNSTYRSDDRGISFGAISTPGALSRLVMLANGSALFATTNVYGGGVYRSPDFGLTWSNVSGALPTDDLIIDLVLDPQAANTLYVLFQTDGLYKSVDGGAWSLVNSLASLGPRKLAIDPGAPAQMLLATVQNGLLTSSDSGAHWAGDGTAPAAAYSWVGYAPTTPTARNGAAVAVPYNGRIIHRAARTQNWASGLQVKFPLVYDAAFDPHDTDPTKGTLLIASSEGPLLSQDGGVTLAVRSQGIRGATVANLVAGRDTGGTMYAALSSGPIGMHRRTAGSWVSANNAQLRTLVPSAFQPTALAVDPADPLTVLVASVGSLMTSFDGGDSWSGPHPGITSGVIRSLQFMPSNPQIVYVSVDPDGVYRSDNHGATWFKYATGLPLSIGPLAVDPTSTTVATATVYAAASNPGATPRVFKTTNGGASWAAASTGIDAEWIVSLAIDPTNPQIVYAGASGNGEGTFKSTNGGQSWARVGPPAGDDPAITIAVDPVVPTTVAMAINALGGASRSVDGGVNWENLASLPAGAYVVTNVVLDPLKPSNILATADAGLMELEVAPDLAVTFLTPPPATLALGGSGSATLRVNNRGPFGASAVVLNITLPAGITAPAPAAPQGSCSQVGNGIRCAFGGMLAPQRIDVPLTLTAGSAPMLGALSASVVAHESDPAPNDNSISTPIEIKRLADLGVTLASSATSLDHHAALTLTATVTNTGPNASSATKVAIELGTALTYQGATPSKGACTQTGTIVTCTLGVMDPTASATVAIAVVADGLGTLSASAVVSDAGLQDPVGANDSGTASVTSRSVADLAVQITDAADPVTAGESLSYTATVTNNGPDDATSATVTISIGGATVTSATSPQGSCLPNGTTAICTLNALANGATATVTVGANATTAGTATAAANVTSTGTDKTAGNDAASQSTTINAAPSGGGGSSGGGGGGAFGELEVLALLALVLGRRRLPSRA